MRTFETGSGVRDLSNTLRESPQTHWDTLRLITDLRQGDTRPRHKKSLAGIELIIEVSMIAISIEGKSRKVLVGKVQGAERMRKVDILTAIIFETFSQNRQFFETRTHPWKEGDV